MTGGISTASRTSLLCYRANSQQARGGLSSLRVDAADAFPGGERDQNAVPQPFLGQRIECPVAEHALMELARRPAPATTVSDGQIVEQQQFARRERDFDESSLDVDAAHLQEEQLLGQRGEFRPAAELRFGLQAGQDGRITRGVNEARQAALAVTAGVLVGAVAATVEAQPPEEVSISEAVGSQRAASGSRGASRRQTAAWRPARGAP